MRKKTEEKRQAIIDTALEVFLELGYEQASMAEIAARVGGSKATLYGYFESKEEMFIEVMLGSAADEIKIAIALLDVSKPIRETLMNLGKQYLTALLKPQLLAMRRLAMHEAGRSSIGVQFYERGPKHGWSLVTEFLQQAIRLGHLRKCNATVAAAHLRALYEAELLEPSSLGVSVDTSPRNVAKVVARAVDAFMAAYGNGDAEG
ncbi:TetR/AcrR family transcriptional regulator [Dyella acidisoli]|uniref:TetR family transcriptional regulator n=1 Tax=Dyella acidisoli TaxID=1867834 RepID=A0ABQ5XIP7_9GAMM|nr:TetR/AcrR family transcriptional regulator [Dyella acidisoli]GLQ91585.1 TetR family transcriptional regulator [Dyella acidisoli]